MYKSIIKLDELTSNKIAAGEVVDRPASVAKELVENSIDANAKNIIVEIKNGGKSYIRVTDDGYGISATDVEIAFERHATSKLKNIEDLHKIMSLGFRGEALASIVSVSQVEVITKTENATVGTYLTIHGGKIVARKEIGCPRGTTIVVENLFYNTPARYEFMKSVASEAGYISDIIGKLALAHPHISFRFINNGTIIFTTSGSGNILNTITSIYGKDIAQNMTPINFEAENLTMDGYISNPSLARGNRQLQSFFVNGRYVKSMIITKALEEAYKTLMPIGKYPVCFIYFKIPPDNIDINIHPAKTEIRFKEDENIKQVVIGCIKNVLFNKMNLIPEILIKKDQKTESLDNIAMELPNTATINYTRSCAPNISIEEDKSYYNSNNKIENQFNMKNNDDNWNNHDEHYKNEQHIEVNASIPLPQITILGQLFNTYLIGQDGNNLYLIDQHAAHERILYEWLVTKYKNQSILSQKLLTPILVELTMSEFATAHNHMDILKGLGFEIEEFGINSIILRSVPVIFGEPEAKQFFLEVLDSIPEGVSDSYDVKVERIIMQACKNAIKAKDRLNVLEIDELMKQMSKLKNPYTCPHGRPIIVSMSKYEIERRFKRV